MHSSLEINVESEVVLSQIFIMCAWIFSEIASYDTQS